MVNGGEVAYDWITEPVGVESEGEQPMYVFTFAGCVWNYFVSTKVWPEALLLKLTADGKLPVGVLPISEMSLIRAVVEDHLKGKKKT